ncbi:glycosyltransferase [Kiloniella majae]|uniref:glycosyltransferase n=1 Tax=Kiloniella majae TaxID=1938558 RepID=UPI000A27928F|nr:glycosyltransferase [Kiloniella majae]
MTKVIHLITGLGLGGAEIMLTKLVGSLGPDSGHSVISMTGSGVLGERINVLGVPLYNLGMSRGFPDPRAALKLYRLLKQLQPDVLVTWLYHADLLGLAVGRVAGVPAICWNIRCSQMDMSRYSMLAKVMPKMLARLSPLPDACIVNSWAGRAFHERLGYTPKRWEFIPNGFELDKFCPNPQAGRAFRQEIGVAANKLLIGLPARVDPQKDHDTFIAAASIIAKARADIDFVLIGSGTSKQDTDFIRKFQGAGIEKRSHFLGPRTDMDKIYSALDLVTLSSSFGEGFPNILGEAMSTGVPCVATDVGDSALIIGETGRTVAPGDVEGLAAAWLDVLGSDMDDLKIKARVHINDYYSIEKIVLQYTNLLADIYNNSRRPRVVD